MFEVYEWLVYEAQAGVAQFGLQRMRRSLEIVYPGAAELDEVAAVLAAMPGWQGTLEDALVAVNGLKLGVPVWTLNFRDLSAFGALHYWSPAAS